MTFNSCSRGDARCSAPLRILRRTDKVPDQLGNPIRSGVQSEMASINDVDFSLRHVAAIGLRFRGVERELILAPDNQQTRLIFAHPGLPLGVGLDVRAIVVEQVALNLSLARLAEKVEFIAP